jgi:hypothetical protein
MLEESLLSIALYNADLGHTAPGQAPEKRRLNFQRLGECFLWIWLALRVYLARESKVRSSVD